MTVGTFNIKWDGVKPDSQLRSRPLDLHEGRGTPRKIERERERIGSSDTTHKREKKKRIFKKNKKTQKRRNEIKFSKNDERCAETQQRATSGHKDSTSVWN